MAAGLGLLRLSPTDFWLMTPREFERAVSAFVGAASPPLLRDDLAALMRVYPDATG